MPDFFWRPCKVKLTFTFYIFFVGPEAINGDPVSLLLEFDIICCSIHVFSLSAQHWPKFLNISGTGVSILVYSYGYIPSIQL